MLHVIGDYFRNLFLSIPIDAARVAFLAVPLSLMVWIIQIPAEKATRNSDSRWYEDLRVWAWIALSLQVLIYSTW